jgi:hypothetical protein
MEIQNDLYRVVFKWLKEDGPFPFEVRGNYSSTDVKAMIMGFLKKNHLAIDRVADEVMQNANIKIQIY